MKLRLNKKGWFSIPGSLVHSKIRHTNATLYGKAGGTYANDLNKINIPDVKILSAKDFNNLTQTQQFKKENPNYNLYGFTDVNTNKAFIMDRGEELNAKVVRHEITERQIFDDLVAKELAEKSHEMNPIQLNAKELISYEVHWRRSDANMKKLKTNIYSGITPISDLTHAKETAKSIRKTGAKATIYKVMRKDEFPYPTLRYEKLTAKIPKKFGIFKSKFYLVSAKEKTIIDKTFDRDMEAFDFAYEDTKLGWRGYTSRRGKHIINLLEKRKDYKVKKLSDIKLIAKNKRPKQYELTTTRTGVDMPYQVFGKNKNEAMKSVKKQLRKGEKIISLERVYW